MAKKPATPATPAPAAKTATRVVTPEAILSYPHLFEPTIAPGAKEASYSASFVFPAGTDLKTLKLAAIAAGKDKFGDKFEAGVRNGSIKLPFRTDVEEKGYPEGSTFINARSKQRPGVVSIFPDPSNGGKPTPITDTDKVYPGVIVIASLTAFGYDKAGNKGVSFALNNVQVRRDGERLDSRKAATDEFAADESAVASLEDLTGEDESGSDEDVLAALNA
jgi:hypothetical protein